MIIYFLIVKQMVIILFIKKKGLLHGPFLINRLMVMLLAASAEKCIPIHILDQVVVTNR